MDIVKNNLTNLIPIVNPALKIEKGIKLAIMYRILPTTEIDSSELVKEAYKKLYRIRKRCQERENQANRREPRSKHPDVFGR